MTLLPNKIELARMIAIQAHSSQKYGKLLPYMYHVDLVVSVVRKFVPSGHEHFETLIICAYLHDAIEDTNVSYNSVKEIFGELIAETIWVVSGNGRNRVERNKDAYSKIRKLELAKALKICDRIANGLHSKAFNKQKIAMYRKENLGFIKGTEIDISKDPLVILLRTELQKFFAA